MELCGVNYKQVQQHFFFGAKFSYIIFNKKTTDFVNEKVVEMSFKQSKRENLWFLNFGVFCRRRWSNSPL